MSDDAQDCLNCGEELTGPFCAHCGQKEVDLGRSFWQVVFDAIGEAFEVDGKLHRTAVPFLLRPGELPQRWARGQRARFTSPVRLFVFALFAGFVGLQFTGESMGNLVPDDPLVFDDEGNAALKIGMLDVKLDGASGEDVGLSQQGFVLELVQHMVDAGPAAVALMVPLFAIALQLLLWRRRFVDHLVFSLVHHSRLLLFAGLLLPIVGGWGVLVTWLLVQTYLLLALRRTYELDPWPTFWRGALLVVGHTVAMVTVLVTVLVWSVVDTIGEDGDEADAEFLFQDEPPE